MKAPSASRQPRRLLAALAFVAAAALLLFGLNDLLRKKWSDTQPIVQGYYLEPAGSLDVLCLGASGLKSGVSGLEMFHDYGFTTYSRATGAQLPMVSYHLLMETLEKHELKAVVMDATPLCNTMLSGYTEQDIVGKIHEAVDYMPWSRHKADIVRAAADMGLPTSMVDYLLPVSLYHDRWMELDRDDFTHAEWQGDYCYKGQEPSLEVTPFSFESDFMRDDSVDELFEIDAEASDYVGQMIQLCRERGVAFVLIKTPSTGWTQYYHERVDAFARENGIDFLDFNLSELRKAIGFDPRKDFADSGGHCNISGAKKLSEYLGQYLSAACVLEDRREDPDFASWSQDYEKYARLLEDYALNSETNLISFLERLDDPDYLTLIATRDDTSKYFNDDVAQAFGRLGLKGDFARARYLSYLAVLDGGEVVYQRQDEDLADNSRRIDCEMELEGHRIELSSTAARIHSAVSMKLDGEECAPNGRGFNFVVYDRSLGRAVCQRAFNTGARGTDYAPVDAFSQAKSDPMAYLDLLADEDTIAVLGVSAEGSRYMPGLVNDRLERMGLIPLDREFNRPYIAILEGGSVLYNAYGEPDTQLSVSRGVGEVPVVVVSSAQSGEKHLYVAIGDEELSMNSKEVGLTAVVYSKSRRRVVSQVRFDWSNDYLSEVSVKGVTDVRQLLSTSRINGYDVLCLYAPAKDGQLPEDAAKALSEAGLEGLTAGEYFAGALRGGAEPLGMSDGLGAGAGYDAGGVAVRLRSDGEGRSADVAGVVYSANRAGLWLLVYDPQCRAVLGELYCDPE